MADSFQLLSLLGTPTITLSGWRQLYFEEQAAYLKVDNQQLDKDHLTELLKKWQLASLTLLQGAKTCRTKSRSPTFRDRLAIIVFCFENNYFLIQMFAASIVGLHSILPNLRGLRGIARRSVTLQNVFFHGNPIARFKCRVGNAFLPTIWN